MIARVIFLLFAACFLWLISLSVTALKVGLSEYYFEAGRFGKVYKAGQPILYWMYFGLHVLLILFCLIVSIVCALLGIFAPVSK